MQKTKKLLSLLLAALLAIGLVPFGAVTANAAETENGYTYTVANGTATITGADSSVV